MKGREKMKQSNTPTKLSTLIAQGPNEYGFDVYQNAYYRLYVAPLEKNQLTDYQSYGRLTVWIEDLRENEKKPVIIEEKGFLYSPKHEVSNQHQPLYIEYRRKQNMEGDYPEYLLSRVNSLVRAVRKQAPIEGAKQLVKDCLTIIKQKQAKIIKAEQTHRHIYLTLLTNQYQVDRFALYEKNGRFPCDLGVAVALLNETAK